MSVRMHHYINTQRDKKAKVNKSVSHIHKNNNRGPFTLSLYYSEHIPERTQGNHMDPVMKAILERNWEKSQLATQNTPAVEFK